ncbi:thiolase-like protein [Xylaria castorea]|nr:thiolase-like protein [Xylaria castorea]
MLSPNGRSFMWDASADGYTRGEGFAAIFLKTLSQAIKDGDHIECIVRETGVNSDGKTPGITMPSSELQARLARDTYSRCGLGPALESDRPQYFEAQGTGTPAVDRNIKTVIGHTGGTAGLAGVLKALLTVQHGKIPANLYFNTFNPKIKPFYRNLRNPNKTSAWPDVPKESPRRVSVNSFGFGDINAYAIIESWDGYRYNPRIWTNGYATNGYSTNGHGTNGHATNRPAINGYALNGYARPNGNFPNLKPREIKASNDTKLNGRTTVKANAAPEAQRAGPFVLSANSGTTLAASAAALATYLRATPETDLSRLVYTLFRRTEFPFRATFSATSAEQLVDKLEAATESLKSSTRTATIPEVLPPRVLGVFTGQGAQWATMGKELYAASESFRDAIDRMQDSLNPLPLDDRPNWTLVDQLIAPLKTSRVGEAAVSQPLCTALQVALVDVFRTAGIQFAAVVGHSSGEIAAAYAAGYLDATDTIRVAYYTFPPRARTRGETRQNDGGGHVSRPSHRVLQRLWRGGYRGRQQLTDQLHPGRRCRSHRHGQSPAS